MGFCHWTESDFLLFLFKGLPGIVTDDEISKVEKLLAEGKERRRHIRIIGVGEEGIGKTTLCKRLLQKILKEEDLSKIQKTEGIETHMYAAKIIDGKVEVGDVTGNMIIY